MFGKDDKLIDPHYQHSPRQTAELSADANFGVPGPAPVGQPAAQPTAMSAAERLSLEPAVAPTFETPVYASAPAAPAVNQDAFVKREEPEISAAAAAAPKLPASFFARTTDIRMVAVGNAEVSTSPEPPAYQQPQNAPVEPPAPQTAETRETAPAPHQDIQTPAQQTGKSALEQTHHALSHEGILQTRGDVLIEAVVLQATIEQAIGGDAKALTDLQENGLQALKSISANLQGPALEGMAKATRALVYEGYISLAPAPVKQAAIEMTGSQLTHADRVAARGPAAFAAAI